MQVYALVLGEVAEATAIADRRLEGWLEECRGGMAQCDEAALAGDERIGKAALALQAMVGERTGSKKLQAVTQAVMALGQGDLGLTPDELLPLLVLSVRQAEVKDLYAELAFIEEFSDVRQLLGAEGYAYVSVQVRKRQGGQCGRIQGILSDVYRLGVVGMYAGCSSVYPAALQSSVHIS